MTTYSHALAAALARHATHTFGLMGNGNAHLIDALGERGLPLSTVRHEAATVASADAYARVSGKLAIATATYGAGFTNTVTALAEAAQARTPLLLVVGDAPTSGNRPWDIDQALLGTSLGVNTYEVLPDAIDRVVEQAVAEALGKRTPVVLSLPYDCVQAEVPKAPEAPARGTQSSAEFAPPQVAGVALVAPAVHPTDDELLTAATMLAAAERPVVLAGHGAWIAGAGAELGAIAKQLGALTATTALARGIFPEAQFDLGLTGGFGQDAAMQKITEADVILVVGAGLNQFTMRFGELFGENAKVIRVDLDEVAPPRSLHPIEHTLLRGDARNILTALVTMLSSAVSPSAGLATNRTRPWRESVTGLEPGGELRVLDSGTDSPDGLLEDGLLDPRAVAARIGELLPEDRHVTSDGGHFIGWANMFWPVASPERMIMVGTAYQTIGLGLATTAGVAAAAPTSTVVVTTGDGGGLMALADLETTIRTAASSVIVVWNDAAYGAEVHLYGLMGLDESPMLIPRVDFAGLATALGARGVRVETLADLEALSEWRAEGAKGSILLDCRVSRSVIAPYQKEILRANGVKI